jgi:hypothetical protein
MLEQAVSYLSPKLEGRENLAKGGFGVFVCEPVKAGEILVVWGGYIVTEEQLALILPEARNVVIQVEENLYQVTYPGGQAEWINHSCEPNAGMRGQITLVAMRNIFPGEEVCMDYAMTDGNSYGEFECKCGSPLCRKHITGNDWRDRTLWERYAGYFSPYLQRRIELLKTKPRKLQEAEEKPIPLIIN